MTPLTDRANPTTRLLALTLCTTPLLFSIDWVSAGLSLALTLFVLAPLCGITPWRAAAAGWPLFIAAPLAALSMALYAAPGEDIYWQWGLMQISGRSIELAGAIALRVLAVGLPAIVLIRGIDPTRFGDGLAQIWRLPATVVIGAVAGVRMLTLLSRDWQAVERARRARGLPRRPLAQAFNLLVIALRRGTKLATAMEARGFGRSGPRTWARPATLGWWDTALIALSCILPAISLGAAIYTGHFLLLGVG